MSDKKMEYRQDAVDNQQEIKKDIEDANRKEAHEKPSNLVKESEQLRKQLQQQELSTRDNLDSCIIKVCPPLLGLLFGFLPYIAKEFATYSSIKLATLSLTFCLIAALAANFVSQIYSLKESRAVRGVESPSNWTALFNTIYQWAFIVALIIILILTAIVLFIQP